MTSEETKMIKQCKRCGTNLQKDRIESFTKYCASCSQEIHSWDK